MGTEIELYLAGTGSFAVEVGEWAEDAGWNVVGLIELLEPSRIGTTLAGHRVVAAEPLPPEGRAVLAIGSDRPEHWSRLQRYGWRAGSVVHPRAHVSPSASIGAGCVVAPGAVIGAEAVIGEHTLISRGSLVGHHAGIGSFVSVLPGANLGGHAEVEDRATLGMGAVIVNGTRIGSDATVAAGAVVLGEVGTRSRVQGVPAREYTG
jgi:sugar O-acyltransferase (sialic acid O-acetyltransferase NeuD family)